MEHMLSHASRKLQILQVHALEIYRSGATNVQMICNDTHELLISTITSPAISHISALIEMHYRNTLIMLSDSKDSLMNILRLSPIPGYLSFYISSISKWNYSHVFAGCIGLCIGSSIGIILGLNLHNCTQFITSVKAVVVNSYIGIEGISSLEDVPAPVITSSDEILVHVKAGSLDIIDLKIASGYARIIRSVYKSNIWKRCQHLPVVLGRDCAGIIVELGHDVRRFEVGDEVWLALPFWMSGTLAEYIVIKECYVSLKPKVLGFEGSASIPYAGCIAWDAVCCKARLNTISAYNKRVLVHCGNTSTGCMILQLCRAFGANVTVSCLSFAKNAMLNLAVDHVIVLESLDIEQLLLTNEKFDIVFNTVGASSNEFCRQLCKVDGKVISTAVKYYSSDSFSPVASSLYAIWLRIKKLILGQKMWEDVAINSTILEELSNMVNNGQLIPVVDKVFVVNNAERALRYISSANFIGKTVLSFSNDDSTVNKRHRKLNVLQ